ncbi:MAG: DUF4199 domain-containing protein [Bacteroidota bacterium]
MAKTSNPLFLVPLKFGLIGAAFNVLAILVVFYLGKHPLLLNPLVNGQLVLYALIIFASFKYFKDQYSEGILHFWQGLAIGLFAYIVMSSVIAIFIYGFSAVEDTQFLSEFIRLKTNELTLNKDAYFEAMGVGEEAYNRALSALPGTKPIHLALLYIRQSILIGLLLTIVFSILMRNKVSTNR